MADPHILLVTSTGSPSSAVVPILAAIEAAGMRVRAIDVGGAGGGTGSVADRIRRTFLGEGAERRLRKELELAPPDAAVVFDPHVALALTVVRDQATNPAPVIGVVAELEPIAAWGQTDCDRFVAIDDIAAVALADAGVEGERILVVGAIGERAFAEAGQQDRTSLRSRFKLGGKAAMIEVAGMGPELTGQLALQLSLLDGNDQITFLFDAGADVEAAAVLRRQVPALGLKAKLFGSSSADAALLWRAADVLVARPRPEVLARAMLVGGKLVALIDDTIPGGAKAVASLEARKRAVAAKGLLLLSSAMDASMRGAHPPPTADGADHTADIVAIVAGDKRGVIDERRAAANAATRDRVRAASAAASAVAATTAMPGELEDLSGGTSVVDDAPPIPDRAEIERLRVEVKRRVAELTRSMSAAQTASRELREQAKQATGDEAVQLDKKADSEAARMHGMLSELATLETELKELERVAKIAADAPKVPPKASQPMSEQDLDDLGDVRIPRTAPRSVDDALSELKKRAGNPAPSTPRQSGPPPKPTSSSTSSPPPKKKSTTVEDELAALKQKMQGAPPKKK